MTHAVHAEWESHAAVALCPWRNAHTVQQHSISNLNLQGRNRSALDLNTVAWSRNRYLAVLQDRQICTSISARTSKKTQIKSETTLYPGETSPPAPGGRGGGTTQHGTQVVVRLDVESDAPAQTRTNANKRSTRRHCAIRHRMPSQEQLTLQSVTRRVLAPHTLTRDYSYCILL
jgi:hypothetical protein